LFNPTRHSYWQNCGQLLEFVNLGVTKEKNYGIVKR
jgi:hypothetical protein